MEYLTAVGSGLGRGTGKEESFPKESTEQVSHWISIFVGWKRYVNFERRWIQKRRTREICSTNHVKKKWLFWLPIRIILAIQHVVGCANNAFYRNQDPAATEHWIKLKIGGLNEFLAYAVLFPHGGWVFRNVCHRLNSGKIWIYKYQDAVIITAALLLADLKRH